MCPLIELVLTAWLSETVSCDKSPVTNINFAGLHKEGENVCCDASRIGRLCRFQLRVSSPSLVICPGRLRLMELLLPTTISRRMSHKSRNIRIPSQNVINQIRLSSFSPGDTELLESDDMLEILKIRISYTHLIFKIAKTYVDALIHLI